MNHLHTIGIAIDAIERAVGECDVPFVAIPCGGCPPIARGSPGSGGVEHFSVNARCGDANRAVAVRVRPWRGVADGNSGRPGGLAVGGWGLAIGGCCVDEIGKDVGDVC